MFKFMQIKQIKMNQTKNIMIRAPSFSWYNQIGADKILLDPYSPCSKQQNIRHYSQQKKSFLGGFIEQLREEFSKNKEMKDSIQKFREEAKKLEQSDALKEARKKIQRN